MRFILNIGLDVAGTVTLHADAARQMLAANGMLIVRDAVHQSDTEATLVAEVQPLTTSPLLVLQGLRQTAVDLGQDCIAVYRPETGGGSLVGPNAKAWGDFNPAFFLNLDGSRLATEERAAA